ncbi:MAG: hypothetical protein ACJAZV_002185 [Roseivirga sp.]|jgi:hypothetical protein
MKWLRITIVATLCLLGLSKPIFAQNSTEFNLESFIEELFNLQDTDANYEDLYESLFLLYQNPLNINLASTDELKSLYVLSNQQIVNLQNYIQERGKLLTLYELQLIEGFDFATLEKIRPFVRVNAKDAIADNRPLLKRILEERNNYLITRYERGIEQKRGYSPKENETDNRYAGSADKLYMRYRVSKLGDFSIGITTEKDAGESMAWQPKSKNYLMDFWSFHFMLENQGKWRKMIIGDYQLQFGQGLLFGAGFSVGKGSETVNTADRVTLGIRPYSSVLESGFLRGAATTYSINKKLNVTAFASRLPQDASIQEGAGADDFNQFFSSIQSSGLHRTATELANKRSVVETLFGTNLNLKPNDRSEAGITLATNHFSTPILRSDDPHNLFEFRGNTNLNLGLYGKYNWHQFSFFGESAISKSGGIGALGGFSTNLSPRIEFAMVFRNYAKDFHSIRGAAFAEGSRNINESGVYWGMKYTLNKKFYLTTYYDTYHFPWLRFRVDAPSGGKDYLIRFNYNPGGRTRIYFQFRKETKEVNAALDEMNDNLVLPGTKKQYLANLEFAANNQLSFKSRVQFSDYEINNQLTDGYAFIQDAVYHIKDFVFSARIALFDTEGNENRQYAYERDVLYAFSIPAYSGRGIRNYLLIQYQASRKLEFWGRIARTTYYDRTEIGTGLERIDGNKLTNIKLQLRYKLQ